MSHLLDLFDEPESGTDLKEVDKVNDDAQADSTSTAGTKKSGAGKKKKRATKRDTSATKAATDQGDESNAPKNDDAAASGEDSGKDGAHARTSRQRQKGERTSGDRAHSSDKKTSTSPKRGKKAKGQKSKRKSGDGDADGDDNGEDDRGTADAEADAEVDADRHHHHRHHHGHHHHHRHHRKDAEEDDTAKEAEHEEERRDEAKSDGGSDVEESAVNRSDFESGATQSSPSTTSGYEDESERSDDDKSDFDSSDSSDADKRKAAAAKRDSLSKKVSDRKKVKRVQMVEPRASATDDTKADSNGDAKKKKVVRVVSRRKSADGGDEEKEKIVDADGDEMAFIRRPSGMFLEKQPSMLAASGKYLSRADFLEALGNRLDQEEDIDSMALYSGAADSDQIPVAAYLELANDELGLLRQPDEPWVEPDESEEEGAAADGADGGGVKRAATGSTKKRKRGAKDVEAAAAPPVSKKLGTMLGVFLPCLQNILGVILFLRLAWIVGQGGIWQTMLLIAICCATTFLTALSMSAIATNGRVPGGGSYYMISRALGPEFGGAVGVLFFLGTSLAGAMYILGAAEVIISTFPETEFLKEAAPGLAMRVLSLIILFCIVMLIFVGIKVASVIGSMALAAVLISVFSIYLGIIVNTADPPLADDAAASMLEAMANASMSTMETAMDAVESIEVAVVNATTSADAGGITGIRGATISDNWLSMYTVDEFGAVVDFQYLLALFFPSVTGIMAGSNRSDVLSDPSRSIPKGTLMAIFVTSLLYELTAFLLGASVTRASLLNIKKIVVANLAWPTRWLVLAGIFLSTFGAGIQSLMGAPRLLAAISKDGIVPALTPLAKLNGGEPKRALIFAAFLCFCGLMAGNINAITPIITMFFLLCYGFVNFACFINSMLRLPNWRPRWRFYHAVTALLGMLLCVTLMFLISWWAALIAIVVSASLWIYIHLKGVEANWGDGLKGFKVELARSTLLALPEEPVHSKNWRPQVLAITGLHQSDWVPLHLQLFTFLNQLKKARGLSVVAAVLEGDYASCADAVAAANRNIGNAMRQADVPGFRKVLASHDVWDGIEMLIQHAGLGGLDPNTVLMQWPNEEEIEDRRFTRRYVDAIHLAASLKKTMIIARNMHLFPLNSERRTGTIDIWWILHDGGILLLLPYLLRKHSVWKRCKVRLFSVAQLTDDSVQMERDLKQLMYQLRLDCTVHIVEMGGGDISDYAHQRTVYMQNRAQAIEELGLRVPSDPDADSPAFSKLGMSLGNMNIPSSNVGSDDDNDASKKKKVRGDKKKVKRMNTAVQLNRHLAENSAESDLVLINLPPDQKDQSPYEYLTYVNVLTEGLQAALLVRGAGVEVITLYS